MSFVNNTINMFYQTLKTSPTGQKFDALCQRIQQSRDAIEAFLAKHGTTQYVASDFLIEGDISMVVFEDTIPDPTLWIPKKGRPHEYVPNRRNKKGKAISQEIANLPKVTRKQLNQCVGINDSLSHIGLTENELFFGFWVPEKLLSDFVMPIDCIEITRSEYEAINKNVD